MTNVYELLAKISESFDAAIKSAKHPLRTASVATVSELGLPQVRTMVLRKFDEVNKLIGFHSDYRSDKIAHITKNPNIQILFYDKPGKLQLRITGKAKVHYQNNITLDAWNLMVDNPKKCYSCKSRPGQLLNDSSLLEYVKIEDGYNNFSIIECAISTIDYLYLASSGHQRYLINFENGSISLQHIMP